MLNLYTDGACRGNGKDAGGVGGWGVGWRVGSDWDGVCGGAHGVTNNQMELTAGLEALKHARAAGATAVTIYSDSQYLVKGVQEWLPGWKRKNWRTAAGQPVFNQDLWCALDAAQQALQELGVQVTWSWVRGHNGDPGNEFADRLANKGADGVMGLVARPVPASAAFTGGALVEFQGGDGFWLPGIVVGPAHDDPRVCIIQERLGLGRYAPQPLRVSGDRLRASQPRS